MKRILTLVLAMMMCLISVSVFADGEKTTVTIWSKDRHEAEYVQKKIDEYAGIEAGIGETGWGLTTWRACSATACTGRAWATRLSTASAS